MKVLFITSTRLGDGVISTAALDYIIRHNPNCEITVAGGSLVKGIYEQFPEVKNFITLKKEPYSKHWIKLWIQVYKTRWDIIVDLRNSLVSRLLLSSKKYIWSRADESLHKVEQLAQCLRTDERLSTRLAFKPETIRKASEFIKDGEKVLAIGPTSNWMPKTWPSEYFIELARKLQADYAFDKIAVIAAPGEETIGYKVYDALPEDKRLDVIAKTSPEICAAIISRTALYIGNDSGLMHCAAAAGIPTLGLFGPTNSVSYSPYGKKAAFVRTAESKEQLIEKIKDNPQPLPSLMTSLSVDTVYAEAKKLYESNH